MIFNLSKALVIKPGADFNPQAPSDDVVNALYESDGRHLMLESVTMEDVELTYFDHMDFDHEAAMMLEAITTSKTRLSRTMAAFNRALNQQMAGSDLSAGEAEIGRARKASGMAVMPAIIPLSDGQTITVMFHSPTNDPSKIAGNDTLVAFRFLLNKRDVTHVVSPDGGRDVSLKQTCLSLANLAERNSRKFKASQERTEKLKNDLVAYQAQAAQLEEEARQLTEQGDKLGKLVESEQNELDRVKSVADKQVAINDELRKEIEQAKQAKTEAQKVKATKAANHVPDSGKTPASGDLLKQLNPALWKSIIDSVTTIYMIDSGQERGLTRSLFVNSMAEKIKRQHKNGNQDVVDAALALIRELQDTIATKHNWDKPQISDRHSIWKLGSVSTETVAAKSEPVGDQAKASVVRKTVPVIQIMQGEFAAQELTPIRGAGWELRSGAGENEGQYVLTAKVDDSKSEIELVSAFSSEEDAIAWAKANRNTKREKQKANALSQDLHRKVMDIGAANGGAGNNTADAFIDPTAAPEKQEQQRRAVYAMYEDVAKAIQAYMSENGIAVDAPKMRVIPAAMLMALFGLEAGALSNAFPAGESVNVSLKPGEALKLDGESIINGTITRDDCLRLLNGYGGEFVAGRQAEPEQQAEQPAAQAEQAAPAQEPEQEQQKPTAPPADLLNQLPMDYIRSAGINRKYFGAYMDEAGGELEKAIYMSFTSNLDDKPVAEHRTRAKAMYASELMRLPREADVNPEILKAIAKDPDMTAHTAGLQKHFFKWMDSDGSLFSQDDKENASKEMLERLKKDGAKAMRELVSKVRTEDMGENVFRIADTGKFVGERPVKTSVGELSVPMAAANYTFSEFGNNPGGDTRRNDGYTVMPQFSEDGYWSERYRVEHPLGNIESYGDADQVKEYLRAEFDKQREKAGAKAEPAANTLQAVASKLYNEIKADGLHSAIKVTLDDNAPIVEIISHDGVDYQIVPTTDGQYAVMGGGDELGRGAGWDEIKDLLADDMSFEFDEEIIDRELNKKYIEKGVQLVRDMGKSLKKLIKAPYEVGVSGTVKNEWGGYGQQSIDIGLDERSDKYQEYRELSGRHLEIEDVGVYVWPEYVGDTKEPTGTFSMTYGEGSPISMAGVKVDGLTDAKEIRKSAYAVIEAQYNEAMEPYKAKAEAEAEAKADSSANDGQSSATANAIATLERIRDTNTSSMSLAEVRALSVEVETAINALTEGGAYAENESLAEAATVPVIERMMELAA